MSQVSVSEVFKNITVGLAVSFVAISLGASLGILSGRGAFAGMVSAGMIAIVTSLFGGTRIQCSGPTAPMSTLSAVVVAYAVSEYSAQMSSDQFITLVFLMMALMMVVAGVLRLGRFITLVPNVVISGFMSGIALLIWSGQLGVLFGFGGKVALEGAVIWNVIITIMTVALIFVCPVIIKRISPKLALYLPGTLLAIIIATVFANVLGLSVQFTSLESDVETIQDLGRVVAAQIPVSVGFSDIMLAFPFAAQLTLLCFLDTLLTSLVIDNMTKEKTRQNKELIAQGAANGAAALLGGIPGAQATIRSVLMIKENATMRIAGVFVGVFVFIEIFMFKDLFSYIPSAVFCGVLFKVGYDVFDWQPVKLYARQILKKSVESVGHNVSHLDMIFITGTMLVTLFFDLNAAVIAFTALFYGTDKVMSLRKRRLLDVSSDQTEGMSDEP